MRALSTALASGLLFALGLGLSGMTDPANIQAFLDVTGAWNPQLLFVMGGALATHGLLRAWLVRRGTVCVPAPTHHRVDGRLVVGAALFGVGWGVTGFCPGPALVGLATGRGSVGVFVGAMLAGMGLFQLLERRRRSALGDSRPGAPVQPGVLKGA